ncbi:NfeD family protein [Vreelandella subglaciescola]|uniref:NfeD family protein n=1 Tax=Vreelandella subglaciescola TaxID=29571 RepID=UPI0009A70398|nr:NfeD family protein [Halomonas subglaciescola]
MLYSFDLLGIALLILGVSMLTDAGVLTITLPVLIGVGLFTAALLLWVLMRFIRQRKIRVRGGQEQLLDSRATALYAFHGRGHVRLQGERWRARSKAPVACGEVVSVTRVEGLTLHVSPVAQPPKEGAEP